jgi:hypothetical protein
MHNHKMSLRGDGLLSHSEIKFKVLGPWITIDGFHSPPSIVSKHDCSPNGGYNSIISRNHLSYRFISITFFSLIVSNVSVACEELSQTSRFLIRICSGFQAHRTQRQMPF